MTVSDTIRLQLGGTTYTIDSDPSKFTLAETNAVERYTGMTIKEWGEKLRDRSISSLAWTALAWVAVRRAGRLVKWRDFEEEVSLVELLEAIGPPDDAQPS